VSLLYYNEITKNTEEAVKLRENIKKTVTPYEVYVKTAIKSFKDKESIKANWIKVGGEPIRLHPKNKLKFYKITPKTIIEVQVDSTKIEAGTFEVVKESEDFDFDDSLKIKKLKIKTKIKIGNSQEKVKTVILDLDQNDLVKFSKGEIYTLEDEWSEIQIKPIWLENNESERLSVKTIKQDVKSLKFDIVNDNRFSIENFNSSKPIYINDKKSEYNIVDEFNENDLSDYQTIEEDSFKYILAKAKPIGNCFIATEEIPSSLVDHLIFKDSKLKFEFNTVENLKDLKFQVDSGDAVKDRILLYNNIEFVIEKLATKSDDKDKFRIQLKEFDNNIDDTVTKSPLDYFFEDGAEIYTEHSDKKQGGRKVKQVYEIIRNTAKSSDFSFVLKEKGDRKNKKFNGRNEIPRFPDNETLKLRVNTYQLEKQYEALNILINMPLKEQENILKLFQPIKEVDWLDFDLQQLKEEEWEVLTDKRRSGSEKQRSFVEKSLSTSDYMILEGPPGSGKTTAILELIRQLTKRKKRVLLCGSTHVAIDNVLERLKESKLMDGILPIRIGDRNRISEDIKEFQLDKILEDNGLEENKDLLLEAANLVCGTTIGILQHPFFKVDRDSKSRAKIRGLNNIWIKEEPVFPKFDYLIIDESSKTTFSEFLVPALYAKKWILVGDVKQLSPFTDKEVIESNLNHIQVKNKPMPKDLQNACYILYKFCLDKRSEFRDKSFIINMNEKELSFLAKEIECRKGNLGSQGKKKKYLIISDTIKANDFMNSKKQLDILTLKEAKRKAIYFSYDFAGIFITSANLKELECYIPADFILLRKNGEQNYSFNFKQNLSFKVNERENFQKAINSAANEFKEKNWGSEIAWRLSRSFELRDTGGKKSQTKKGYQEVISALLPMSLPETEREVFTIEQVALPSILECLQRGIKKREKFHATTTLTEGFENIRNNSSIFNKRYEKLTFQHRMHHEISQTPRELFYNNEALKDAKQLDREWDYNRYKKRSVWIDHHNKAFGSKNEEEVKIIRAEILAFYRWAENKGKMSRFSMQKKGNLVLNIKLHTVDKFQGQEADLIFLSMVNTDRDGFMDNPNRLNVAITRAKYQFVIVGMHSYYSNRSKSEELNSIAKQTKKFR